MIFDWIFTAISGIVAGIFNAVPDLPSDVSGAIFANDFFVGGWVPHAISAYIPWDFMVGVFAALAAWWTFCWGYRITFFVLDKLHITGGGGE